MPKPAPELAPPASETAEQSPIRLVIFDFDGTLSDSGEWFLSVVDQLAARFRFRTVVDGEVEMLRHKSTREVIQYLGIPNWKLPFIARYIRKLVYRRHGEIHLFPGVGDLLDRLAATGVQLALVTSNSEANARAILGPENAAKFDIWACGSSLYGKAPKFRRVLKRARVSPAEALAIGDETRDVDAAREVGMRAGSVLWGYASEEALAGAAPNALFRQIDEIAEFVARHQ
ncbi:MULTISPECIES: HAD-IA family hydrolase [unclassified Sphingosinithalassobacter]|uniref:HAD-IA family hydrolase n=1 Tax=unclassified Sphingosinithalassobacter TaxID=2676235 RepID=UPI00165E30C7|nr:HAD-IA family hydrolase [Sphingosinithalassobacter sp. CS137]